MAKKKTLEDKIKENMPFLKAFDYLAEVYEITQEQLARKFGKHGSLISEYRSGKKQPTKDTIYALARVSNGTLNVNYMLGKSKYMLLKNVPENEILENNNPDREVMEEKKTEPLNVPDLSSYINALLAKSDEVISSLKRELAAKNDIIKEKDERIADLQQLAEERLHRIAELRRMLDANNISLAAGFPFPVGTAEKKMEVKNK